jgi:membrane associated rhomboid family serine protease
VYDPVTRILVGINIAVSVWLWVTGAWTSDPALVAHGALVPEYVRQRGEWWRLVSGAFLHANLVHIAVNMISLWQLGSVLELLLGSARMLQLYTLAMLGSGLAVVYFSADQTQATVGASGAIYGLFGALIAIGLRLGRRGYAMVMSMVPILIINLVITFVFPFISVFAHLGGLVSGFAVGLAMSPTPRGRALLLRERPQAVVAPQALPAHEADVAPDELPP